MCDVVFPRKRGDNRSGKGSKVSETKSSILEKFSRIVHSGDGDKILQEAVPNQSNERKTTGSERSEQSKVVKLRAVVGSSIGIFNHSRRSTFVHRSTSGPRDVHREAVVHKAFDEEAFFSDRPTAERTNRVTSDRPTSEIIGQVDRQHNNPRSVSRSVKESTFSEKHVEEACSETRSTAQCRGGISTTSSRRSYSQTHPQSTSSATSVPKPCLDHQAFALEDGIEQRRQLFQQVVSSWHSNEIRDIIGAIGREEGEEALAAREYRTCRKLHAMLASEQFADASQILKNEGGMSARSSAEARLSTTNLMRALHQSQKNAMQALARVQQLRRIHIEDCLRRPAEETIEDESSDPRAHHLQASVEKKRPVPDEEDTALAVDDRKWCHSSQSSAVQFSDLREPFESTNTGASFDFTGVNVHRSPTRDLAWYDVSERRTGWGYGAERHHRHENGFSESAGTARRALVPRRLGDGGQLLGKGRDSKLFDDDSFMAETPYGGAGAAPGVNWRLRPGRLAATWGGGEIDEDVAQDRCSSIEMGIIADSVALPAELFSP